MSASRNRRTKRGKSLDRYVQIHHWIMDSYAWGQLTPVQRNTWVEGLRLYNGANNGCLFLPSRLIAERIGVTHTTVVRALQTLVTLGFLEVTRRSEFSKKRRATEYRFTHLRCDRTGKLPSKQFMSLGKRPPESIVTSEHHHRNVDAPMGANRHLN